MLRLATRGSPLALWQAEWVAGRLGGAELVVVETTGDQRQDRPIHELGGQGIFVKEIQAAVLDGRAETVAALRDQIQKMLPGHP